MTSPPDDRSPIAAAASWASRLIAVSLEMVLPGVFGLWVDGRLGTTPLLTLLGFGFGLTLGIWHLIRMTQASEAEAPDQESKSDRKSAGQDKDNRNDI